MSGTGGRVDSQSPCSKSRLREHFLHGNIAELPAQSSSVNRISTIEGFFRVAANSVQKSHADNRCQDVPPKSRIPRIPRSSPTYPKIKKTASKETDSRHRNSTNEGSPSKTNISHIPIPFADKMTANDGSEIEIPIVEKMGSTNKVYPPKSNVLRIPKPSVVNITAVGSDVKLPSIESTDLMAKSKKEGFPSKNNVSRIPEPNTAKMTTSAVLEVETPIVEMMDLMDKSTNEVWPSTNNLSRIPLPKVAKSSTTGGFEAKTSISRLSSSSLLNVVKRAVGEGSQNSICSVDGIIGTLLATAQERHENKQRQIELRESRIPRFSRFGAVHITESSVAETNIEKVDAKVTSTAGGIPMSYAAKMNEIRRSEAKTSSSEMHSIYERSSAQKDTSCLPLPEATDGGTETKISCIITASNEGCPSEKNISHIPIPKNPKQISAADSKTIVASNMPSHTKAKVKLPRIPLSNATRGGSAATTLSSESEASDITRNAVEVMIVEDPSSQIYSNDRSMAASAEKTKTDHHCQAEFVAGPKAADVTAGRVAQSTTTGTKRINEDNLDQARPRKSCIPIIPSFKRRKVGNQWLTGELTPSQSFPLSKAFAAVKPAASVDSTLTCEKTPDEPRREKPTSIQVIKAPRKLHRSSKLVSKTAKAEIGPHLPLTTEPYKELSEVVPEKRSDVVHSILPKRSLSNKKLQHKNVYDMKSWLPSKQELKQVQKNPFSELDQNQKVLQNLLQAELDRNQELKTAYRLAIEELEIMKLKRKDISLDLLDIKNERVFWEEGIREKEAARDMLKYELAEIEAEEIKLNIEEKRLESQLSEIRNQPDHHKKENLELMAKCEKIKRLSLKQQEIFDKQKEALKSTDTLQQLQKEIQEIKGSSISIKSCKSQTKQLLQKLTVVEKSLHSTLGGHIKLSFSGVARYSDPAFKAIYLFLTHLLPALPSVEGDPLQRSLKQNIQTALQNLSGLNSLSM